MTGGNGENHSRSGYTLGMLYRLPVSGHNVFLMGPIQIIYRDSVPFDALRIPGVEFEGFGHQVFSAVAGCRHTLVSMLISVGEDMEKLMRQHAAEGAAEKRFPLFLRVTNCQRSDRMADPVALQFTEREHPPIRDFSGTERRAFSVGPQFAE